jgi:predicted dehydrogenase
MKLRVGIVGLGGQWDSRYLPALRSLADRFEVRGICEQVAHLAARTAKALNATPVDGFRALAARDDIDAILYLADQWYGATPILAACEHGKAVYSAISLPFDAEEAALLRSRVEASGIAFMVELPRRHAPATVCLKELIDTRLGPPRVPLAVGPAAASSRDEASEARDLMELVDWCRYVVGTDATSVVGVRHAESPGSALEDYQMLSLDFTDEGIPGDGVLAQISCGYYMPQEWEEAVGFRPPPALQVVCRSGIAFIDLPANLVWFDTAGRHQESLDSERPIGECMLLQFHRKVTSLVRPTSGRDDALAAMHVVHAATQSQAEGRRIPL